MLFSTSWDDGHPLDLKLADLLDRHGFTGTFYVPFRNREGLPVLDAAGLRQLDSRFEVGSHTLDHAYANSMGPVEWAGQVTEGKRVLEDQLGHPVLGFCYPGGKRRADSRQLVEQAGFAHARTGVNLHVDAGSDRLLVPTTLQFFPHRTDVLVRNYVKGRAYGRRWPATMRVLRAGGCVHRRLLSLLELALAQDGVFHVWGHSWELEKSGLWGEFEAFLSSASALVHRSQRVTNAVVAERLR